MNKLWSINSQISAAKDLVTSQNYTDAVMLIMTARDKVALTKDVPLDFSAIKVDPAVALSSLITTFDEVPANASLNEVSGTAHALDQARLLATMLERGLPPTQRLSQYSARLPAASTPDVPDANPMLPFNITDAAYKANDYIKTVEYGQRYLAIKSLQTSQH